MKEKLVFDDGFYDRIMQEVEEMEMIAANVKKMLRDRVSIEKDTSDDGDGKDASKEAEKRQEIRDMLREEGRAHFNLDADPPKTMRARFHPADVELFYECNHKEEARDLINGAERAHVNLEEGVI